MKKMHYLIATVLGAGYSPTAPGTAGTLVGLLVAYFFFQGDAIWLVPATLIATAIGTYSADFVEKDAGIQDPSKVVVDELAGMWLGLWFVPPEPLLYLIAFGLFRLFDVSKLYPLNRLQDLPGGWGIMLDDIGAGIYTLLIMHIIIYFW